MDWLNRLEQMDGVVGLIGKDLVIWVVGLVGMDQVIWVVGVGWVGFGYLGYLGC